MGQGLNGLHENSWHRKRRLRRETEAGGQKEGEREGKVEYAALHVTRHRSNPFSAAQSHNRTLPENKPRTGQSLGRKAGKREKRDQIFFEAAPREERTRNRMDVSDLDLLVS